jgi:hypothetical protein
MTGVVAIALVVIAIIGMALMALGVGVLLDQLISGPRRRR